MKNNEDVLDTKAELAKHVDRRAKYKAKLGALEKEINQNEISYLEDTMSRGNVSKQFLSPTPRPEYQSENAFNRAFSRHYKPSDHIFSYSSTSSTVSKFESFGKEEDDEEDEVDTVPFKSVAKKCKMAQGSSTSADKTVYYDCDEDEVDVGEKSRSVNGSGKTVNICDQTISLSFSGEGSKMSDNSPSGSGSGEGSSDRD